MKTVRFGSKILAPSKIICIGRNYVEHVRELGNEISENMVIFLKPNSAISNELVSHHQEPIHYEAEICFLFENGRFSAVGFGLDLTKREMQNKLKSKGLPWERAKAFNGSAVFSSFVPITAISPQLSLELKINHQLVQAGSVEQMIYKPAQILAEIKTFLELEDGDIIMTGTPQGVGKVQTGAVFEGSILAHGKILTGGTWQAR